jgi:hypothetical protein
MAVARGGLVHDGRDAAGSCQERATHRDALILKFICLSDNSRLTASAARNAAHLARLLETSPFPAG